MPIHRCETCNYETIHYTAIRNHYKSYKHERNTNLTIKKETMEILESTKKEVIKEEITTVPIEKYNEALTEINLLKEKIDLLESEVQKNKVEHLQEINELLKKIMKL